MFKVTKKYMFIAENLENCFKTRKMKENPIHSYHPEYHRRLFAVYLGGFIRKITSENCLPFNLICIPEFTHWFFQMLDV